jgi:hypothetical protein
VSPGSSGQRAAAAEKHYEVRNQLAFLFRSVLGGRTKSEQSIRDFRSEIPGAQIAHKPGKADVLRGGVATFGRLWRVVARFSHIILGVRVLRWRRYAKLASWETLRIP